MGLGVWTKGRSTAASWGRFGRSITRPCGSVNIPAEVEAIGNSDVACGDYSSASEMVCAAVRLLDRRKREKQRQIEKLRSMLQEAIEELDNGQWPMDRR
jgi:putative addiction module CopG family antidote